MRIKVLIYVVLSLLLSLPLDIAAQYRTDYDDPIILKSITDAIGNPPELGSVADQLDEDYFSIAFGIRFIATMTDDQQWVYRVDEDVRKKCKKYYNLAWEHDMECNANTMLNLFKTDLDIDPSKLDPTKVGILCKFIEDVFVVNKILKNTYNRWRPWYHFWGKFDTEGKLTNYKEIKELIDSDYELSKRNEYCLSKIDRSYPSGHSVVAYASAIMMANLFYTDSPMTKEEIATKLMKTAHEFAMSRVILGVHHYSDIRASYNQAVKIVDLVKESIFFKTDLGKLNIDPSDISTDIAKPIWGLNGLFIDVAKEGRLKFACLDHGNEINMRVNKSIGATRFYTDPYHCERSRRCRIHCLWNSKKKK